MSLPPILIPLWLFYVIIALFSAIITVLGLYWFVFRWRSKIQANIIQDFKIIKSFRLKKTVDSFKFGKRTYKVYLKNAIKNSKNAPILNYNIDDVSPMGIIKEDLMKPEDLQTYQKSTALEKILSGGKATKMLFIIMCIAITSIGVVAGVGFYFINNSNTNLQILFREYMNITRGG